MLNTSLIFQYAGIKRITESPISFRGSIPVPFRLDSGHDPERFGFELKQTLDSQIKDWRNKSLEYRVEMDEREDADGKSGWLYIRPVLKWTRVMSSHAALLIMQWAPRVIPLVSHIPTGDLKRDRDDLIERLYDVVPRITGTQDWVLRDVVVRALFFQFRSGQYVLCNPSIFDTIETDPAPKAARSEMDCILDWSWPCKYWCSTIWISDPKAANIVLLPRLYYTETTDGIEIGIYR